MILLGDPLTCPVDYFLKQVNEDFPGLTVVGAWHREAGAKGGVALFRIGELFALERWGFCWAGMLVCEPLYPKGVGLLASP